MGLQIPEVKNTINNSHVFFLLCSILLTVNGYNLQSAVYCPRLYSYFNIYFVTSESQLEEVRQCTEMIYDSRSTAQIQNTVQCIYASRTNQRLPLTQICTKFRIIKSYMISLLLPQWLMQVQKNLICRDFHFVTFCTVNPNYILSGVKSQKTVICPVFGKKSGLWSLFILEISVINKAL